MSFVSNNAMERTFKTRGKFKLIAVSNVLWFGEVSCL